MSKHSSACLASDSLNDFPKEKPGVENLTAPFLPSSALAITIHSSANLERVFCVKSAHLPTQAPLNLIFASPGSESFSVQYHGGDTNRGHVVAPLSTLGVEDFSLNATQIYPNPSNGEFLIKAKTTLREVNVYSQTGTFVRTIKVEELDTTEVNINGLQTGVYLLELVNDTEKSWKKVIVN